MTARRTLRALLEQSVERFGDAGLSYGHGTTNALDEAAWLILHALGHPLHELNPHLDEPLDATQWRKARALIDRRIRTRKPAAYLLKEAWLGPHRFHVDERVIVPRSFIAELLLKPGRTPFPASRDGVPPDGKWGTSPFSVLDLCTGSGCLAILAALAFGEAQVDAADLSDDALAVARINVASYGLEGRVHLVKSDLFAALGGRAYDLIVSNPPYVKAASMRTLPDEYRQEPQMALASGRDGLDHTRTILAQAKRHLKPGGRLVVEIGHNRKALERAYPQLPFEWPATSAGPGFVFTLGREQLPGA
jgi:ribosomal protein L3 glutamine methyltransferase